MGVKLTSKGKTYIAGLDGLRALAVISVIVAHSGVPYATGGKTGVILFFVLSGFLITSILLRELDRSGRINLSVFYVNRVLRLLPAMILATTVYLGLSLALAPFSATARQSLEAIPAAYLHCLNWWNIAVHEPGSSSAGYLGLYWSLAVEEQFYVLWPFILWIAYRVNGRRGVMWLAFAGATASYLVKWLFVADPVRQTGTDLSADALLVGCGLAILVAERKVLVGKVTKFLILPASATLVLAFVFGHADAGASELQAAIYSRGWWPLSIVASAVLVGACASEAVPSWLMAVLELAPIKYLGVISYGIYLWHQVPLQSIRTFWDTDGALSLVRLLVVTGLTVALAAASYHLVERKFLALKREPAGLRKESEQGKLPVA